VAKFVNAQLAFADTLEGSKPFVNEAVWQAFFEFGNSIIMWKDGGMPKEYRKESRDAARISLERCAEQIRKRFSELLVM
jgi:hypothetical protein